ncbi:MAG TPA: addiction module toxin, HicA family [Firmicutes bacterium]|jgi:predicted RNA binding protein YcfA (HicA-like mRNA interferase family)|nr:addiction module toxin, HicA family [Bacillota bacterium]
MTPRLPRISGKDVKRAPLKAGFREVHTRGSHHYLEPVGGGKLVTVPIHGTKTLKQKTLKSILGQAGLTADELVRLL